MLGHHRSAIKMAVRWQADDGPASSGILIPSPHQLKTMLELDPL